MTHSGALSLRQKLANGQNVYGTCITSSAPMWPKVLKQVGADFVFLDTEHIPLGRPELATLCQLFRAHGITPIVRIPSPDPFLACQAIDGGAGGIVAPYLESTAQIRELVGATKYRPLKGEILAKYLSGEEEVPADLQKYLAHYNGDTLCIANIESVPALERLEALLSVPGPSTLGVATPGVDAVFIGPHDLSVSMGLPEQYDHPEFERAVRTIIHTCRQKGISVGIHFSLEPERQVQWIREGATIVVHSFDVALFTQRLRHDFSLIRQAVGDEVLANTAGNLIV